MTPRKKVLLIVIDALASDVVRPAMQSGHLPCLSELADRGQYADSTAIFPSITPAATASIVTGAYPRAHGIVGAHWWNADDNTVAFFGADLWLVFGGGPGKYFRDFMVHLNEKYLLVDPVFQKIERNQLTSAVINYMWFRGDQRHEVNAPLMMELLGGSGIPETVAGPSHLALAEFVPLNLPSGNSHRVKAGIGRRYGFDDDATTEYLHRLLQEESTPDLTVAYFPNNDFDSHEQGPVAALKTVQKVDQSLAKLIQKHGGWDNFLDQYAVVLTGDHSQSQTHGDAADRDVDLSDLLKGFQQAQPAKPWQIGDQILICPNLRAAQIYTAEALAYEELKRLFDTLLSEKRIDQVLLQSVEGERVQYSVMTADRGSLIFWSAGSDAISQSAVVDDYGNRWEFEGILEVIDAKIERGQIRYRDYPNALERIANGFPERSAGLWVTARLGCEFRIAETHTHPGGSHGTLHKLDSTSPLIATGLPQDVPFPVNPRTIDIAPLCEAILGRQD